LREYASRCNVFGGGGGRGEGHYNGELENPYQVVDSVKNLLDSVRGGMRRTLGGPTLCVLRPGSDSGGRHGKGEESRAKPRQYS